VTELLQLLPHPAAVHIPLALAVLFPAFYLAAWWSVKRNLMPARLWTFLWALALVQMITLGLAYISGEHAEFLSAGSQVRIDRHEQLATIFSIMWFCIFVALSLGVWRAGLRTAAFHVAVSAILTGQLLVALWLGHIGGGLVN